MQPGPHPIIANDTIECDSGHLVCACVRVCVCASCHLYVFVVHFVCVSVYATV